MQCIPPPLAVLDSFLTLVGLAALTLLTLLFILFLFTFVLFLLFSGRLSAKREGAEVGLLINSHTRQSKTNSCSIHQGRGYIKETVERSGEGEDVRCPKCQGKG
jgi:hypothetical protein